MFTRSPYYSRPLQFAEKCEGTVELQGTLSPAKIKGANLISLMNNLDDVRDKISAEFILEISMLVLRLFNKTFALFYTGHHMI